MKKRFTFSLFNLTEETSAEVVKLQGIVKGLVGSIAVSTWFAVSPELSGVLTISGAVIIELLGCLKVVTDEQA